MNNKNLVRMGIFFLGIAFCTLPDFLALNEDLDYNAKIALRMVLLMIFFWLTEIIPISVTALVPLIFSPFFFDIKINQIASHYASPVVFLLLGGFILALGFEKSNLHQRVAIRSILIFGNTRGKIMISLICSTAFFSMWFSNTATCLLMLPIVKNIIDTNFKNSNDAHFSKLLILSVAYSSSIGGMATPIGTIPNAVMIGFLKENYNVDIDFVGWFSFIFPLVLILIFTMWFFLKLRFKDTKEKLKKDLIIKKYKMLGNLSREEKITSAIIFLTACLWIFKRYLNNFLDINLSDSAIAIFGSIFFFLVPTKNNKTILDFNWFKKIPWNVLILFGGGLSMASLIVSTGLAEEMSKMLGFLENLNLLTIIFLIALVTSLLTEFTSNTATTFLFLPLLSIFAINNNLDLVQVLLPFVLAASCAFMMPIATPPNAIVYSSNRFRISFMVSNGFFINIISILIISSYIFLFNKFFEY